MAQRKIKKLFLSSIPFLFLFILWNITCYFGWIPSWLLPAPIEMITTFVELIKNGVILEILGASALNVLPPYLCAVIVATILGIMIGTSTTVRQIFFPFISTLYPVPSLAWLPIIIILTGFTRQSIWILLFISSFFKMIYNMIGGVRSVNPIWVLVAKNLGLKRMQIIFKVIIPGALPNIITGLRMGFGASWRSLVGAEMLVSGAGGLGKFIWMAQWSFSFAKVFIGILLIAIIGLGVEIFIFKKLEKITLEKWGAVDA